MKSILKLVLITAAFFFQGEGARAGDNKQSFRVEWGYNENLGHESYLVNCFYEGFPGKCFFDTGDPNNILPGTIARESANFPALKKMGSVSQRRAKLKLGSFISPISWAYRHDSDVPSPVGVTGFSALGDGTWKFDMKSNEITLESAIPADLQPGLMVRSSQGHFALPAKIGGVDVAVLFDTGTNAGIWIDINFYKLNNSSFADCVSAQTREGVKTNTLLCKISGLQIGGKTFNNYAAIVTNFDDEPVFKYLLQSGMAAILGKDIIDGNIWHLDLKNNRWAIGQD
jgi:hypothetical protein